MIAYQSSIYDKIVSIELFRYFSRFAVLIILNRVIAKKNTIANTADRGLRDTSADTHVLFHRKDCQDFLLLLKF